MNECSFKKNTLRAHNKGHLIYFNLYFLNKYLMKNIYRILFNKNLLNECYYDYENKIIY